ncbi:DUF5677 domain-containing protein [Planococcus rifietoensis]|uniref:DUF5677 domain-containing protein n=1 Tax=Planococcus rifietoensis TaxID=200991 RepID=UPI00384F2C0A
MSLKAIIRESDKVSESVLEKFPQNGEEAFDFHDAVIIGLFEDMIGKARAFNSLLEAKNGHALDVVMRSFLESYVYLSYILEEDTPKRGRAYGYGSKLNDIKILNRLNENSRIGRKLREFLDISKEQVEVDYSDALDQEYQKRIKDEYSLAIGSEETKRTWYNADGKTASFETLCNNLGMLSEYEFIYRIFSKEVHSTDALSRMKFEGKEVLIGVFQKDALLHSSMASLYLVEGGRKVLSFYNLKKELRQFNAMVKINHLIQ